MNQEQTIDLVKQAGWNELGADLWGASGDGAMSTYALQRFAELVRADALEEAAKAVDKMANDKKATQQQQFALDLASDLVRSLK